MNTDNIFTTILIIKMDLSHNDLAQLPPLFRFFIDLLV